MEMILSNNGLYDKVRETISALKRVGMNSEAHNLDMAMKISSMPGEILGEIRLVLQDIDTTRLAKEDAYDVESEITYINSILG
jgi:hypothetical protein